MIRKIWDRVVNFYIYSLFAGPIALALLMSGDQDYIINKALTTYFLCVLVSAFVLWPLTALIEKIKGKVKQ